MSAVARSFTYVALGAALLAAIALPGEAAGFNLAMVWLAITVTVWLGTRDALDGSDRALVALAAIPPVLALVRGALWVAALQLIVALVAVGVGVGRARGWMSIVRAPLRVFGKLPGGLAFATRSLHGPLRDVSQQWEPALRSALVTGCLLVVFGGLFLSADAAFASITQDWLVPNIDFTLVPARIAVFGSTLALIGSLALLSPAHHEPVAWPWGPTPRERSPFTFRPLEWTTALIALDVLFAAFVAVQVAVLFGGHAHVLETTGLTYAEYARQGFFQLIVVAILTIGVIVATIRFGDHEHDRAWVKGLLGVLIVLTLVILLSAWTRMDLYQQAYGFTRLRLLVDLAIYWLTAIFGLLLVAGAMWNGRWLPRAVVSVSVVAVVLFGVSDPDARIAERNVERYEVTGHIDLAYLSGLSVDAVPALSQLEHPRAGCIVGEILRRSNATDSLWSFNLARRRAFDISGPICNS